MLKQLAARADERWKSIPSFRDPPKLQQPAPAIGVNDPGGYVAPEVQSNSGEGVASIVESSESEAQPPKNEFAEAAAKREVREKKLEQSPWKAPQKGAPSENWQPESWTPGAAQRR
jgi:NADH dehydrogenase [ubiquinone] 1 alpha subcomplex assembly factor 2